MAGGVIVRVPPQPKSTDVCVLLLGLFTLLIVARLPTAMWQGRFWAEEGPIFYLNALTKPLSQSLFAIYTGYVNIIGNTAAVLATQVSPENAPHVTMLIALGFQILPGILLATADIPWLKNPWSFALALLIVVLPPGSEEVWLNSITSQYLLMLCAALVLMFEPARGKIRFLHYGVLILAPLTGPGGVIMAPLFALRAGLDRSRLRLWQAMFIGVPALVQGYIIITHMPNGRIHDFDPGLLATVFYVKNILIPFGGPRAGHWAEAIRTAIQQGHHPLRCLFVPWMVVGGLAIAVRQRPELCWALLAALVSITVCTIGAVGQTQIDLLNYGAGNRYYYVSWVLFGLILLGLAHEPTWIRFPASLLVLGMLLVGLRCYWVTMPDMASGPQWSQQVAAWRQGAPLVQGWGAVRPWTFAMPR